MAANTILHEASAVTDELRELERCEQENARLKELVVQLYEIVLRDVVNRAPGPTIETPGSLLCADIKVFKTVVVLDRVKAGSAVPLRSRPSIDQTLMQVSQSLQSSAAHLLLDHAQRLRFRDGGARRPFCTKRSNLRPL